MIYIDQHNRVTTDALKVWGPSHQIAIMQEEAGEVVTAVSRLERGRTGKERVAEEIADFFVSSMSVIKAYDLEPLVDRYMREKIQRLADRLRDDVVGVAVPLDTGNPTDNGPVWLEEGCGGQGPSPFR